MLAVFLSPVYLLFQAYILLWLYAWADSCSPALHSLFFRIPVTVLYLFFAVSPLTGFLITKEPLHHFLRVISNYWLGTLEYILLFIITFDVIRRVTGHSFFMKYRYPAMLHTMPKNLVIFGGFAIGLILMVSIYGVLHARRVYVRQDPVVIEKSSSLPGLKIALIADLHLGYNSTKSHVRKIVDTINSQNVDLVCIAGDLFDNDYNAIKDPDEVADILSDIKSRYGTYACWGNHDVSEKILAGFTFPQKETIVRDGRFTEFLHHAGITMLEDETVCINNAFYLVGRRDKDMAKKEQLPGGAKALCEEGAMKDVDLIYGFHCASAFPLGTIAVTPRAYSAAIGIYEVKIHGKGGHGGYPQNALNPVPVACMVGSALNQILAEKKNPLEGGVLTVSYINGGQYPNIITDTVTLGGNVRTLNNDLIDKVFDSIHSISRGICAGFGLTCDVTTTLGYPAAINVPEEIETVRSVTRDLGYTVYERPDALGGEDFAYYLLEKPGAYFQIGMADPERPITSSPHHNCHFQLDERGISEALEMELGLYLRVTGQM